MLSKRVCVVLLHPLRLREGLHDIKWRGCFWFRFRFRFLLVCRLQWQYWLFADDGDLGWRWCVEMVEGTKAQPFAEAFVDAEGEAVMVVRPE
ncbi:MAG: hypothetical protein AAF352_08055 [Pseudomonadota bacterium]